MKIMLLNPPGSRTWFRDGYCSTSSKSGYCWHPMDLLVQSGILTEHGYTVALVDAIALQLTPQQTISRVAAFAPDLVLSLMGDASWPEDVRFLRRLGSAGLTPHLIVSGDTPRYEPERTFQELPLLNGILTDFTTPAVVQYLEGETAIAGLTTQSTAIRAKGRHWSAAPARHDLISRQSYRLPFHQGMPFASVLSSYGCPFSCTFCNTGELGYKLRPIGETLAEITLIKELGYSRMYLRDATANGHRASFLSLCKAIAKANVNLQWNTFCTYEPFDAELAQAMSEAGCTVVQMGFETASELQRAQSGKAFANSSAFAAVRYAHEAGIKVCGHFVLGLPGQDATGVQETAQFARDLDLDYASFNLASARPGTTLRAAADSAGIGGGDASDSGFVEGLSELNAAQLMQLRREAILRFYLRTRPLKSIVPDLTSKQGWKQLIQTASALSRVF